MPSLINVCISTRVLQALAVGRESEIANILKMFVITRSKLLAAVGSRGIQILANCCVEVYEEPKVLVAYD